jgi:hypothetical protein
LLSERRVAVGRETLAIGRSIFRTTRRVGSNDQTRARRRGQRICRGFSCAENTLAMLIE